MLAKLICLIIALVGFTTAGIGIYHLLTDTHYQGGAIFGGIITLLVALVCLYWSKDWDRKKENA